MPWLFCLGFAIGAGIWLYWVSVFFGVVYTVVMLLIIGLGRRGMLLPAILGFMIGFS
jgi:hypothetical protein